MGGHARTRGVRQLLIPLRADRSLPSPPPPPPPQVELLQWSTSVRQSVQPCVLVSTDGLLIALSEPAARLLGPTARPGVALETWWHELAAHAGDPSGSASVLGRTIATSSPTHSVVVLAVPAGSTTVQVMAAPLQADGGRASALLAFLWPMSTAPAAVRVP